MLATLFVYGTLRRAAGHPMHELLAGQSEAIGAARLAGRLYELGRYPGAVADPACGQHVVGELYRMHDPAVLLPQLDRYEGCTEPSDARAEYRREPCTVLRADGTPATAWVYLYNRPTAGLPAIADGDYLAGRRAAAGRHSAAGRHTRTSDRS